MSLNFFAASRTPSIRIICSGLGCRYWYVLSSSFSRMVFLSVHLVSWGFDDDPQRLRLFSRYLSYFLLVSDHVERAHPIDVTAELALVLRYQYAAEQHVVEQPREHMPVVVP